MPWQQLHFTITAQEVDLISELLFAAGALSVTCSDHQDEAIFEPKENQSLWAETDIVGLFEVTTDMKEVLHNIERGLSPNILPNHHIDILEDAVWERIWLEHFKPICFNEKLWICPSNSEKPLDNKAVLWLDPGLAFGTGTHATTALCLQALTTLSLNGLTVMDYGCGSGILALAALKLGAKKAYAIDNHPQALLATQDNAKKNDISENEIIILPPEECPKIPLDLWIANILLHPLLELESLFAKHIPTGSTLLVSGVLNRQVDDLLKQYAIHFTLQEQFEKDEWVLLQFIRK